VGHLALQLRLRVDEDVAHLALHHGAVSDGRSYERRERGVAEPRHAKLEVDLLVESGRTEEADPGFRRDHVRARLDHVVVPADRLAPELGDDHIEVREVVRVEDDPLRVALAVADAEPVPEDPGHPPEPIPSAPLPTLPEHMFPTRPHPLRPAALRGLDLAIA